jgi:hypothetical protein
MMKCYQFDTVFLTARLFGIRLLGDRLQYLHVLKVILQLGSKQYAPVTVPRPIIRVPSFT